MTTTAVEGIGGLVPIAFIAPAQTALVAVLMLIVIGVSNAFVDVSGFGLFQGSVPDRQWTAAMGAVRAVISLSVAAGGIAASALLSLAGVGVTLLAVGLLLPILAIGWWPRWRDLDDHLLVPREQVDALRHCPIFAPLTLAQLEQLAAGTDPVRFDDGAVVILEGDPGDAFYLITGGAANVTLAGVPLATLRAGDSFGEIALLRGVPRSATVTAASVLDTYRIDAVTFVSAITGNPCSRAAAEDVVARIAPSLAR